MVKYEDLGVSNRSCIESCDIPGCEHVLHLVKPPLEAAKHSTAVLGGGQRRPRPDIQGKQCDVNLQARTCWESQSSPFVLRHFPSWGCASLEPGR